jgi:hypothetical protein
MIGIESRTHHERSAAVMQAHELAAEGAHLRVYDILDGRFVVRTAQEDQADRSARHLRWRLVIACAGRGLALPVMDSTSMLLAHRGEIGRTSVATPAPVLAS